MTLCESGGPIEATVSEHIDPAQISGLQLGVPEVVPIGTTDHGQHYIGRLLVDETVVNFREETPREEEDPAYYFLTGLGGSLESMSIARCAAVHDGFPAYAVAASHNRSQGALAQDAREFTSLVNTTEVGRPKRIVALSMGGAITALAANQLDDVELITLLAPGIAVDASPRQLITNVAEAMLSKAGKLLRDPGESVRAIITEARARVSSPLSFPLVAVQGLRYNLARQRGIQAETRELNDPFEQARIQASLKRAVANPNGPHIRIVAPMADALINPRKLASVARELGIDDFVLYDGVFPTHTGVTQHPAQTKFILDLDRAHTGTSRPKRRHRHAA